MNFLKDLENCSFSAERAYGRSYSYSRVPSIVAINCTIFDKWLWVADKQKTKELFIKGAGAKDTEWIGPICGAKEKHDIYSSFLQVHSPLKLYFPSLLSIHP